MKTFEKNYQEGRIPLRRWPARSFVTIPYKRILTFIPYRSARTQTHTSTAARPSKSVTPIEYQNHYRHASLVCNYFRIKYHIILELSELSISINNLRGGCCARHYPQKASSAWRGDWRPGQGGMRRPRRRPDLRRI